MIGFHEKDDDEINFMPLPPSSPRRDGGCGIDTTRTDDLPKSPVPANDEHEAESAIDNTRSMLVIAAPQHRSSDNSDVMARFNGLSRDGVVAGDGQTDSPDNLFSNSNTAATTRAQPASSNTHDAPCRSLEASRKDDLQLTMRTSSKVRTIAIPPSRIDDGESEVEASASHVAEPAGTEQKIAMIHPPNRIEEVSSIDDQHCCHHQQHRHEEKDDYAPSSNQHHHYLLSPTHIEDHQLMKSNAFSSSCDGDADAVSATIGSGTQILQQQQEQRRDSKVDQISTFGDNNKNNASTETLIASSGDGDELARHQLHRYRQLPQSVGTASTERSGNTTAVESVGNVIPPVVGLVPSSTCRSNKDDLHPSASSSTKLQDRNIVVTPATIKFSVIGTNQPEAISNNSSIITQSQQHQVNEEEATIDPIKGAASAAVVAASKTMSVGKDDDEQVSHSAASGGDKNNTSNATTTESQNCGGTSPQEQAKNNNDSSTKRKRSSPSRPGQSNGRWTQEEHQAFLEGLHDCGREWKKVAVRIPTRTSAQIRSHAQKYFAKIQRDEGIGGGDILNHPTSTSGGSGSSLGVGGAGCREKKTFTHQSGGGEDGIVATSAMVVGESGDARLISTTIITSQALAPSVQRNVQRIIADPHAAQREVEDTLEALRERYRQLQHRLEERRRQRRSSTNGLGGSGNTNNGRPVEDDHTNDTASTEQLSSAPSSPHHNHHHYHQHRMTMQKSILHRGGDGGSGGADENSSVSSNVSSIHLTNRPDLGNEEMIALEVLGGSLSRGDSSVEEDNNFEDDDNDHHPDRDDNPDVPMGPNSLPRQHQSQQQR